MTTSAGTLPNGTQYANELSPLNANDLITGGGTLYLMPLAGITAMPSDATIEVPQYNVGTILGGFKINSKPKTEEVYNQFEQLVTRYITRENFSIKTGLANWNLDNFQNLSTATTYQTETDKRSVWTGTINKLPPVLVRFVKETADGAVIRFTMVGQGGKGFGLEFGTKPTTFDAEIEGITFFNNFMAEVRQSFPHNAQITPSITPSSTTSTQPSSTSSTQPSSTSSTPTFNTTCTGMTSTSDSITLHFSYTANFDAAATLATNMELELSTSNYNYALSNVTATSFDVVLGDVAYNATYNAEGSGGYLEYTFSSGNIAWTTALPNFTQTATCTCSGGTLEVAATTDRNIVFTLTPKSS